MREVCIEFSSAISTFPSAIKKDSFLDDESIQRVAVFFKLPFDLNELALHSDIFLLFL